MSLTDLLQQIESGGIDYLLREKKQSYAPADMKNMNMPLLEIIFALEEKLKSATIICTQYKQAYINLIDEQKNATAEEREGEPSIPVKTLLSRTQAYIREDDSSKDKVDFIKALYHKIFEDYENTHITKRINSIKRKTESATSRNIFQEGSIKVASGGNAVIGGRQTLKRTKK